MVTPLPLNDTASVITSPDQLVGSIVATVPILPNLILFFTFVVIMLSLYYARARREGSEKSGNLPMAGAIAGLITFTGAIVLFIADGIVNITTVVIVFAVTMIFVMAALFNQD